MFRKWFFLWIGLLPVICLQQAAAQRPAASLPKMPAKLLQEDVRLLKKILEANHPSLYWYTSKDSMDWYFYHTINSITDSLNEVAFKNKLAWLVARIRCGHTTVRFSKAYGRIAASYRYPQFPLALKAWDDSLVVLGNAWQKDTIFKKGTIITSINGHSNRQLLDSIYQFISTDGYADNYKSQLISGNFPGWYKTIMGVDSIYTIGYIDSTGHENLAEIKAYSPHADTTPQKIKITALHKKVDRRLARKMRLLNKRMLLTDTAHSTAFMRIGTFSGGRLKPFFKRSFKTIQKLQLKNLVIDLRENGGGAVSNSIDLVQYLARRPFKLGDSVVAMSRKFRYGRYIHPAWPYWLVMNLAAVKKKDGLVHFKHYEEHYFKPRKRVHFDGAVYIIQGGLTFSAATMAIATLKGQDNIMVTGEETGGGYYGNSAMHIPTIRLPYSGLQVSLPMYRLVIDRTHPKGHGVMPDLEIRPSSAAIREGKDLKLERIQELIQRGNHSAALYRD